MLHEQWKELTFAARAATNHHRTEGVRDKGYIRCGCANGCFQKFQPLVIAFPRSSPFIVIPDVVSQHPASGVVLDPARAQALGLLLQILLPARRGSNPE